MAEVYRARDLKLGRDVAIKVLPEAFARDAERMARFQLEAKVLAFSQSPRYRHDLWPGGFRQHTRPGDPKPPLTSPRAKVS